MQLLSKKLDFPNKIWYNYNILKGKGLNYEKYNNRGIWYQMGC